MRVVIIGENLRDSERLKIMLNEMDCVLRVETVLNSVNEAVEYFLDHEFPDLIFFDVEFKEDNCFQIIRKIHPGCPVVFISSNDEFALEAFRQFGIDYLIKPIRKTDLRRALNKYFWLKGRITDEQKEAPSIKTFRQNSVRRFKNRFLVKTGSRLLFLETREVAYFCARGKNVSLVSEEGNRYPVDYTLDKLQEMLDESMFFRLNRSVICNIRCIVEIKTHINSRLRIGLKAGRQANEAIVSRERVNAFKTWVEN